MYTKILVLTAVIAVAAAFPGGHGTIDYFAPAKYNFEYGVSDAHTGDHKSQHEERLGDVVRGHYKLQEPDGTTRIVHYTADPHNGFNAVVQRQGHAYHPQTIHAAPIISHAAPIIADAGIGGHGLGGGGIGGHGAELAGAALAGAALAGGHGYGH